MKKQRYFVYAIILDADHRVIGHRSSIIEMNKNIPNLPLRAKEMLELWNSDEKRKADGVYAAIVSFNKI